MATSRKRGKFMIFVLSIFLIVLDMFFSCLVHASELDPSSNSNSVIETCSKNDNPNLDVVLLGKQQLQLERLEELVQNLTQLVARLESQFTDSQVKVKKLPLSSYRDEIRDTEKIREEKKLPSKEDALSAEGTKEGSGGGSGAVLVTKYSAFWSDRFQFISAVKLRSKPTCITLLPYKDFEGLSKYFVVGDDEGKFYVFSRSGDVSFEFDTFKELEEPSAVTAVVSYLSVYKNESMIVTGHENGVILMHRVWEMLNGDEWSSLHVERVGRFEMPESGGSRINLLDVHNVGWRRYLIATDGGGRILVFREDGTIYGLATPSRRPIAFLKQRLLFLTETGAGSLDLRSMKLRETECEGLNRSFATNYVFDTVDRSRAYGFTSEGDLIQTLLLGDIMNFKCRLRSKRKFDLEEPLALQAVKGYLLIANRERVFVYNVSTQHYVRAGGLRLMFSAGLDEIISSFLNQQVDLNIGKSIMIPLITSDYEKLVIISLGNGYVAMYRSNLPPSKNEYHSIWWTSPVVIFIVFLIAAYNFFAHKKDALTSWGPDDPFSSTSVTSGAPLGSANGDRSFSDSSRSPEIMELRGGGGLRGSSRYVSPPRYPGGTTSSYRPVPETESRPGPVDPRFRTTLELKFRGSNVEGAGGSKRRDNLFVNSQVVDDNN